MGLKKNNPGCTCCEGCDTCALCSDGCEPDAWQVDFTGYTNSGSCTNCATYLNVSRVISTPIGGDCEKQDGITDTLTACLFELTPPRCRVTVRTQSSNYYIRVVYAFNTGFAITTVTYEKNYGTTKPNCRALSAEEIPYLSHTSNIGDICTVPSDPCLLTAL